MKRFFQFLTCFFVMVLCISSSTFASTIYSHDYFYYTVEDESVTITGYYGQETEVTVPNMIAGNPVNTIASGAFYGTTVTKLNLPDTIMSVEEGAVAYGISVVFNSNTNTPIVSGLTSESAALDNSGQLTNADGNQTTDLNEDTADGDIIEIELDLGSDTVSENQIIDNESLDSIDSEFQEETPNDFGQDDTDSSLSKSIYIVLAIAIAAVVACTIFFIYKKRNN